jgi:cytoskeletal protein CcmA (bactofilin family)
MFGTKQPKPQTRIDCLIGATTTVEGDVAFSGGLRVDGHIKGNVRAVGDQSSTLVLSEHATIEGEIHSHHVVVNGKIIGPVHAGEYLELQEKANVTGDVFYKTLEMRLGAVITGRLVHEPMEGADRAAPLKLAKTV